MKNTLLFKYAFLAVLFCNLGFADTLTYDTIDNYFLNYSQHPERSDPTALQETKKLFNKEAKNKQKIKIFLPLDMLNKKSFGDFTRSFEIHTTDTIKLLGEGKTLYITDASIVMRKPSFYEDCKKKPSTKILEKGEPPFRDSPMIFKKETQHISDPFPVLKIKYNEQVIIPYKFLPNHRDEFNQLLEKAKESDPLLTENPLIGLTIKECFHVFENKDFCNPFIFNSSKDFSFQDQWNALANRTAEPNRPFGFGVLCLRDFVISACLSDKQWGFNGIADEDREKIINAAPFLDKLDHGNKIFRKDAIYPYGELRISGKEKGQDLLLKGFFVRDEDGTLCLILCEMTDNTKPFCDNCPFCGNCNDEGSVNQEKAFKKVCTTKPLEYFINRKKCKK